MYPLYKDYYWNWGKPVGKEPLDPSQIDAQRESYRPVVDPYFKRYTIEVYHYGTFREIAYDSSLLDFRKLKQNEQHAWKKEIVTENSSEMTCLLKNQDDRIVLQETYFFRDGLCISCHAHYPNGPHLSTQKIYYKKFNDPINGVILYDRLNRPVLYKEYTFDEQLYSFVTLLKEVGNFENFTAQFYSNPTLA